MLTLIMIFLVLCSTEALNIGVQNKLSMALRYPRCYLRNATLVFAPLSIDPGSSSLFMMDRLAQNTEGIITFSLDSKTHVAITWTYNVDNTTENRIAVNISSREADALLLKQLAPPKGLIAANGWQLWPLPSLNLQIDTFISKSSREPRLLIRIDSTNLLTDGVYYITAAREAFRGLFVKVRDPGAKGAIILDYIDIKDLNRYKWRIQWVPTESAYRISSMLPDRPDLHLMAFDSVDQLFFDTRPLNATDLTRYRWDINYEGSGVYHLRSQWSTAGGAEINYHKCRLEWLKDKPAGNEACNNKAILQLWTSTSVNKPYSGFSLIAENMLDQQLDSNLKDGDL